MLDLHCHILPGVDDGAPDMAAALAMARALVASGFETVAASPHHGEGPGGDVPMARAAEVRAALSAQLQQEGIALRILPNAEHHLTAELLARCQGGAVETLGGAGHWLLIELPWRGIANLDDALFRLQAKGYRLLLAHPERYGYLDNDKVAALVQRGVRTQLEIGSFVNLYGKNAHYRALELADRGLAHLLASDMHSAVDAATWLKGGLRAVADRYGKSAVRRATLDNPGALLRDAHPDEVAPLAEAR